MNTDHEIGEEQRNERITPSLCAYNSISEFGRVVKLNVEVLCDSGIFGAARFEKTERKGALKAQEELGLSGAAWTREKRYHPHASNVLTSVPVTRASCSQVVLFWLTGERAAS